MHIRIERHIQTALRGAIAPNLGWRLFDFFGGRTQTTAGLRHIQTDQRDVAALAHRPRHGRRGRDGTVCRRRQAGRRRRPGCSGFTVRLARTALLILCCVILCRGRLPPGRRPWLTRLVIRERPLPRVAAGKETGRCQQARNGDRPGHGPLHRWARSNGSLTQNLSACSLAMATRPSCIRRLLCDRRHAHRFLLEFPLAEPDCRCSQA